MSAISELLNSEIPTIFTGGNMVFEIIIWMITGIFALFAGLNFRQIFARSNFDLLLLLFLFPIGLLVFGFEKALILVGVYFIGRLIVKFADKEEKTQSQIPVWLLVILLVLGVGYTGFRVWTDKLSNETIEYAINAQDIFLTEKMPYSEVSPQKLMPGPFAYTLTYIPLSFAPLSVRTQNEFNQLTKITDFQELKSAESLKLVHLSDIGEDPSKIKLETEGVKIFYLFSLLVFLSALFAIGIKFGSLKTSLFILILFLFLPWQSVLLGSIWKVLAIGLFLWTVFFIKKTWVSGIFFAATVAVFPVFILALPLFIGYYMPNIFRKGLWLITLGVLITGFVIVLFAPYFEEQVFGFLPTKIFGFILLFVGMLSGLLQSILGERDEKAPGGFVFAFLAVAVLAIASVVLMTSASNYTQGFEDFGNNIFVKIFTIESQGLSNLAVPAFMLLIMLAFLPRKIYEGGLIVLSSIVILMIVYSFGVPTTGSELLLLFPAMFISVNKLSAPADDKMSRIEHRKQTKPSIPEEPKEDDELESIDDELSETPAPEFAAGYPSYETEESSFDSFDSPAEEEQQNEEEQQSDDGYDLSSDEPQKTESLLADLTEQLESTSDEQDFGKIIEEDNEDKDKDEENS